MITVQYRDSQTEEIIERRSEQEIPSMGQIVRIGFEEHRVLFRWRTVPTCCIVYVQRVPREQRQGEQVAA